MLLLPHSMKARPLFENVLVKPLVKKKETKGGILLPDSKENNDTIEGTVVEVGGGDVLPVAIPRIGGMSDIYTKPVVVKIGEHVVFKQYTATPIKIDGEKYLLVNQRDILTVIDYE